MTVEESARLLHAVVSRTGGERREGQEAMVAAVARSIADEAPTLVQAGTGTGKSLGYLVPAAVAASQGKRVVVSTATLALQRQIVTKDLPAVVDALRDDFGEEITTALLKGRNNYVCLHKVSQGTVDAPQLELGEISATGKEVSELFEWANSTDTGDRDDMESSVSNRAWAQVSIQARECLGTQCPMVDECFSEQARVRARESKLVVTNHTILGIEAMAHDLLGDYDALIVDEAHDLVSRVTEADTHVLDPGAISIASRNIARCGVSGDDLNSAGESLVRVLAQRELGRLAEGLDSALAVVVQAILTSAQEAIRAIGTSGSKETLHKKIAVAEAEALVTVAEYLLDDSDRVMWLAPPEGMSEVQVAERIFTAPLDVAPRISGALVNDRAAVMTSATLAVGGSFDSVRISLGLPKDVATLDAGSPFDYGKQGILYLAKHLPRPFGSGITDEALAELFELIQAAGGRTLGLFSSHAAARKATEYVRQRVDFPVMYQGDGHLAALVKQFKEDEQSCLFGAAALWQGIDVPGAAASLVVIDRIPFPRPDDPIAGARSEQVEARGGSGFMAVSVASAALSMAQGVGRLIRSPGDRGVVAILDSRIATQRYGSWILKSLPPMWHTTDRDVALGALRRLTAGRETT